MNTSYKVDRDRWSKMSIFEQMGNISSEVSRSFKAKRCNNHEDCMRAVSRAIDLFDATVSLLIEKKSIKAKEVLRAKEVYLNAIYDKTGESNDSQNLERYFMQYAIAARLKR